MSVIIKKVHAYNCNEIIKDNETIADYLDLDMLFPIILSASHYFRTPEECPYARGNWILDVTLDNGQIICYKYPKEMPEERFVKFLEPLLSRMHREH